MAGASRLSGPRPLREPGVQHLHLQAPSISELQVFVHYREMVTPADVAVLLESGMLAEAAGEFVVTPKGREWLSKHDRKGAR